MLKNILGLNRTYNKIHKYLLMKLLFGGVFLLPLTLFSSTISNFEIQIKSCEAGDLESCSYLEDHFLKSSKNYKYLKYSYQLCRMGQKISCDIFYPTIKDILLILLVPLFLLLLLKTIDDLSPLKKIALLRIPIICALSHFLYPFFVVVLKLLDVYPGNITANFLYYFVVLIPLTIYLLKKYSIQINFTNFISGQKSTYVLFVALVVLYKLISLHFLLELKGMIVPKYLKLAHTDPHLDFLNFVTLVLLIPIFEELFYKGVIFNLLWSKVNNKIIVLIAAALIFLLSHGNLVQVVVTSGFAFLTFTYYSYQRMDIWPLILVHIISNFFPQLFYRNRYLNEFIRLKTQSNESVFSDLEISIMLTLFCGLMIVLVKKLKSADLSAT